MWSSRVFYSDYCDSINRSPTPYGYYDTGDRSTLIPDTDCSYNSHYSPRIQTSEYRTANLNIRYMSTGNLQDNAITIVHPSCNRGDCYIEENVCGSNAGDPSTFIPDTDCFYNSHYSPGIQNSDYRTEILDIRYMSTGNLQNNAITFGHPSFNNGDYYIEESVTDKSPKVLYKPLLDESISDAHFYNSENYANNSMPSSQHFYFNNYYSDENFVTPESSPVIYKSNYGSTLTDEIQSYPEKRKDATHSGKSKKKVAEIKWTTRNDKQAYHHPWLLTNLKGHTGSILDMDFSNNGKYLTSCGDDPGALASGESSSSSSEGNKESSRSPSVESSSRSMKGLSRRQRKNRRREPTSAEKPKKTSPQKLSFTEPDNKKQVMEQVPLKQFSKFSASADIFEKLLRTYMLSPDQLLLYGYPVETVYCYGSVMIYKSPRTPGHAFSYKKTKFDVNAREFIPKHETTDSGQGSSSSSDSGESVDSEEPVSVSDQASLSHYQLHKSSTWPMAHSMQFERNCVRCGNIFYTTANKYITRDKCIYHWGRLRAVYCPGNKKHGQKEYNCCQGAEDSPGCTKGHVHVWNGIVNGANGPFEDYMRTEPSRCHTRNGTYGVFAVDCEMCYTVRGLECTKVTVVNLRGRVVYDSFVKPDNEIVDYNTRFSGITANLISKHAKPLKQVQCELLHLINENTILIGHGLENDLRALKIVHCNIVDTAHSFPHIKGLPFKRSLKNLAASVLDREIQSEETGHDSYEDACTCMELMLWRVRKDYRDYLESPKTQL